MKAAMEFPGSWKALLKAAYPWMLAVVLAVFVWQAVAAHRTATVATPLDPNRKLTCGTVARGVLLQELPEASGLALSSRAPGTLWSINDSSVAVVYRLDAMGRVLGRVRVTGADVNNWEDVSVAPCNGGSCLYVADTGNGGGTQRNDVVVYRTPEPGPEDSRTAQAEVFNAAYPADEDHEAEALFIAAGQLYLVTKGHPSLVFRFPRQMPAGTLATLERVGQVPTEQLLASTIPRQTRITDAETTPDGKWVIMRTNKALLLYRTDDVIAGRFNQGWHFDLSALDEAQGEGVAMTNSGDVYLASEGGGHGAPGSFAHLTCPLPN